MNRSAGQDEDQPVASCQGAGGTREVEVLALIARGLSYAEVGGQLSISQRTVARHLPSIYGSLGVDSRAEAAAVAFAGA